MSIMYAVAGQHSREASRISTLQRLRPIWCSPSWDAKPRGIASLFTTWLGANCELKCHSDNYMLPWQVRPRCMHLVPHSGQALTNLCLRQVDSHAEGPTARDAGEGTTAPIGDVRLQCLRTCHLCIR